MIILYQTLITQMNPQHTIPVLDDNGAIIVDSHAICAYLCEKYAKTDSLYPKNLVLRAKVDARMHFDTSYLFTRFRFMFEPILYAGAYEISDEKVTFMLKAWPILEAFLEEGEYICGDDLTIADLCCVATIRSMDKYAPIDPTKYTRTLTWLAKIADLPEYQCVNGVGGPEFQAVIDRKIIENRLLATTQTKTE